MAKVIHKQLLVPNFQLQFIVEPKIYSSSNQEEILILPNHRGRLHNKSSIVKNVIDADAVIFNRFQPIVMQTADCIPLVFFNPQSQKMGILHIGFRNLKMSNFYQLIKALNNDLSNFQFIIGPAICSNCYTHDSIIRKAKWLYLKSHFPKYAINHPKRGLIFDLRQATIDRLSQIRVEPDKIQNIMICSHEDLATSFHYNKKLTNRITTRIIQLDRD